MSANIVPTNSPNSVARAGAPAPLSAGSQAPGTELHIGEQIQRSLAALKRYKWLIIAIFAAGSAGGYALTRLIDPKYNVNGTVWVSESGGRGGPIQSPGLISSDLAWVDLAKSYVVLDAVVSRLALYVEPESDADTLVFRSLYPSDSLKTGPYALTIDGSGRRYQLIRRAEERGEQDQVIERGTVGDSIGRKAGFVWSPTPQALGRGRTLNFEVVTPREAAIELFSTLGVALQTNSNLMRFQMSGQQPGVISSTLNSVMRQFISEAERFKKDNLRANAQTIHEQLRIAAAQLQGSQVALETFKVNTITQPNEGTALPGGLSQTTNPVFTAYFADRVNYDNFRRDREAMERLMRDAQKNGGKLSVEDYRAVPSLRTVGPQLDAEVTALSTARAQLATLEQRYTSEHRFVQDQKKVIDVMERERIPQLAASLHTELVSREREMQRRIDGASAELKQIPRRTIEEMRLQREVQLAQTIYVDLSNRAVLADLAAKSALPDVSILDTAVAPRRPASDTALAILGVAIAASLGLGLVLALLFDRLDKRFRYPEQASSELGLDILGAIPTIRRPKNEAQRIADESQLVESFRSLSLSIRSAFDGLGPVQLTISSPGPGDGKSLISANLATALAQGGYRTVLIDGDIRRGALNKVFETDSNPGLLEYLSGESTLSEVIRSTSHPNLSVIPCGKRRHRGPELLASEGMTTLVRELRNQFDAVIVDSAPLGAGIDAYALGAATGTMIMVLRTGETDRKLAQAKLNVLDRMPVRLLGAVLNDIGEQPQFKYYYYHLEGYGSLETAEEAPALIGTGNGKR